MEVLTTVGSPILVKATDEHTGGAYSLSEWELDEGAGPPEHTHPYEDESFYVLSGSVDVRVGDEEFSAEAGSFVLMPKGVPHSFRVTSAARMLTIMSPAGFEQFLKERSDHLRVTGSLPTEVVAELLAAHHRRMEARAAVSPPAPG